MSLTKIDQKVWDYIIIGTGMGGGPAGLKLAQAGYSVLFLEKGLSPQQNSALKGKFAELFPGDKTEVLKKAGRFSETIYDRTNPKNEKKLQPFMGTGVGGSSALYGMVLERFKPSDIESWPISFKDLTQHYEAAEKLFQVKKNLLLRHPDHQNLKTYFQSQGLTPHTLPLAKEELPTCGHCQSILCEHGCKNDAGKICIEPAVKLYNARLICECEVEKLEVTHQQVNRVLATCAGETVYFSGKNIILAAGALKSPIVLLKSGIGNQSGLVGRNLMRHFVDLYALKIDSDPKNLNVKELGFDDYYLYQNQKLGTVQSFGRLPPVEVIMKQLQEQIKSEIGLIPALFFKFFSPIIKLVIKKITSGRLVMASIIEDSPYLENRVWIENNKTYISYKISAADRSKIDLIRSKLKKLFKPFGTMFIASSDKNEMLAHVCGTCRMGTDPKKSVLDTENRIHGIKNLYVLDSSFFPTSGGTNPALTIAANSLRVAEILITRAKKIQVESYEQKNL